MEFYLLKHKCHSTGKYHDVEDKKNRKKLYEIAATMVANQKVTTKSGL